MTDTVKVTSQQILDRIAGARDYEANILVHRLPFELAKGFLKNGMKPEEFAAKTATLQPPLATCRDYMELAWDNANDCRALSAWRSLEQLRAWLFLAGFGDVVDAHWRPDVDQQRYDYYGKKQLVIASLLCGFDWAKHDDKVWRDSILQPATPPATVSIHIVAAYKIVEAALKARGQ